MEKYRIKSFNIGITVLLTLFVAGCNTSNNVLNGLENSNIVKNFTKTNAEQIEEKTNEIIDIESDLIHTSFNGNFPYSINDSKITSTYGESGLSYFSNLYEKSKSYDVENKLENKTSEEIELILENFSNLSIELKRSINIYDIKFQSSVDKIKKQVSYSNSMGYDKENEFLYKKLQNHFFNKYPLHNEYLEILNKISKVSDDISSKIIDYSRKKNYAEYQKEYQDYLIKVQKKYGKHIKRINETDEFNLAYKASMADFEPSKDTIYTLNAFRIVQSIDNGILLMPNTSYRYNNKHIIFVNTNKKFVDEYVFVDRKYKIIYDGLKTYNTILGVKKTIYSFKMIEVDVDNYNYVF